MELEELQKQWDLNQASLYATSDLLIHLHQRQNELIKNSEKLYDLAERSGYKLCDDNIWSKKN